MPWKYNGDSAYWVDEFEEPGVWVGGGGDAFGQFVPDIPVAYAGGEGDAMGRPIPLSPDYIASIQNQPEAPAPSWLAPEDYAASGFIPAGISASTGALPTNAQGSAVPVSQLSANPDPTQAFNFAANPYVTAQNPFSKPINNAIQSYLGRPATQAEILQYSTMLAKNPDDYNWIVNNIQNSEEAARAILQGKQQLIIDPRKGDMTNMWLGADYTQWKPTPEEGGISGFANKYGPYLPGLGATLATLGASSPLLALEGVTPAYGLTTANVIGNAGTPFISGAFNPAALGIATGSQALPYTPTNDAANLFQQGITNPTQMQDIIQMAGYDPFLSADIAGLATSGLSEAAMNQVLGYSYNAAELANTGINPLGTPKPGALPSWLDPSGIAKAIGVPVGISAISKIINPTAPTAVPTGTSGPSNYAPKGQVDYRPIIDLLAPRQISRNLI